MTPTEQYIAKLREALRQCDEAMAYMSEYDIPICLPDRVKEALALPVPNEWQDISTAPKDGTTILGWYVGDICPHPVSYYNGRWAYVTEEQACPTHWMPLPTPQGLKGK